MQDFPHNEAVDHNNLVGMVGLKGVFPKSPRQKLIEKSWKNGFGTNQSNHRVDIRMRS